MVAVNKEVQPVAFTVESFLSPDIIAETVDGVEVEQYMRLWDLTWWYEMAGRTVSLYCCDVVPEWHTLLTAEEVLELNTTIASDPTCTYYN